MLRYNMATGIEKFFAKRQKLQDNVIVSPPPPISPPSSSNVDVAPEEHQLDTEIPDNDELELEEMEDVLGEPIKLQTEKKSAPGPTDLSRLPSDGPAQPVLHCFPGHEIASRNRRFSSAWYRQHEWLEYSQVSDAAFCFHCRHFSTNSSNRNETFMITGFRAWNRATGKSPKQNAFLLHKNSDDHIDSLDRYQAYKEMCESKKTVVTMIDEEHSKQVLENRHYIKTVTEVLRLTATQNIAQWGHREGIKEQNRGNFLKISNCIAKLKHHSVVKN